MELRKIDFGLMAAGLIYAGALWFRVDALAEDSKTVNEARVVRIEKDLEYTKETTERIEKQQQTQDQILRQIYEEVKE